MGVILTIAGFAAVMAAVSAWLRRRDRQGDFDPQSPSTAARPGVRWLLDYGPDGFGRDGSRQRPPG